jgi:hypothetical protein
MASNSGRTDGRPGSSGAERRIRQRDRVRRLEETKHWLDEADIMLQLIEEVDREEELERGRTQKAAASKK